MRRRYVFRRTDIGEGVWSDRRRLFAAVRGLFRRVEAYGEEPVRLRRQGQGWGPELTFWRARVRMIRWGPTARAGDVILLMTADGMVWALRKTKVPKVGLPALTPEWFDRYIGPNVDPAIAQVARVAYAFDRDIECQGALVCKWTVPYSVISQHAWGRAIDLHHPLPPPTGTSLAKNRELFDYLRAHADELHIFHLIVNDVQWTPDSGLHPYSGAFHYHVHVSASADGPGDNYMPGWC